MNSEWTNTLMLILREQCGIVEDFGCMGYHHLLYDPGGYTAWHGYRDSQLKSKLWWTEEIYFVDPCGVSKWPSEHTISDVTIFSNFKCKFFPLHIEILWQYQINYLIYYKSIISRFLFCSRCIKTILYL